MNKYDFEGRTAIVTGGARGIGYATAERLLDSGAAVSLWDIDRGSLDDAVAALSAKGDVQGVTCDVGDWDAQEDAMRETLEETGWCPGPLTPLTRYFAHNGTGDTTFNVFLASSATLVGGPPDPDEAERIEWLSCDAVRAEIGAGRIRDGLSLTGLLHRLAGI